MFCGPAGAFCSVGVPFCAEYGGFVFACVGKGAKISTEK